MVRQDLQRQTKIISPNSIRFCCFEVLFIVTKELTGENHSRSAWRQCSNSLDAERITQSHRKCPLFCSDDAPVIAVLSKLVLPHWLWLIVDHVFPMIPSMSDRDWLQLQELWEWTVASLLTHRSRDLVFSPSPFNLSTLPSAGSGRAGSGRVGGMSWWVMAQARTRSPRQDFSRRRRGTAITILANNWSIMKTDGVGGECSKVTSQANSQHLF